MVIPGRLIWEQGECCLLPIAAARGLEVVLGVMGSSVAQRWVLGLSSMGWGLVLLLQSSHSSHPAGPGCCALSRCAPERPQGSELFVCSFLGEKSCLGKKKKVEINHTPENKICLLKCTSGINGVLQIRQFTAWVSNEKTHPGVKAEWGSDLGSGLPPCTPEPTSLPLHLRSCSLRAPHCLGSADRGDSFPGASSMDLG